jgi:malonyl-CoA decarboxylase
MTDTEVQRIKLADLEFREIKRGVKDSVKTLLRTHEAVHRFESPDEIDDNRLAPDNSAGQGVWDKHCYGLFVPGSDVPQICVYVNLKQLKTSDNAHIANCDAPNDIKSILESPVSPIEKPNTAIFYSITNTSYLKDGGQDTKRTVKIRREAGDKTLGEELIHKVAAHVEKEYGVTNFMTLSPLRRGTDIEAKGLAQWLETALSQDTHTLISERAKQHLARIHSHLPYNQEREDLFQVIRHVGEQYQEGLSAEEQTFFSELMRQLGLVYLSEVKLEDHPKSARDPVAQFHLSNGAQIASIHYLPPGKTTASDSIGGLGLMVNYRYSIPDLAERKANYKNNGAVAIDNALRNLLDEHHQAIESPSNRLCLPIEVEKVLPKRAEVAL